LFVVYRPKVWFEGTSTKVFKFTLEEGGSIIFSFNFPSTLEIIFHLPPSTCVPIELARVSIKKGSIPSLRGFLGCGCYFLDS
jgi:hypothetical protein